MFLLLPLYLLAMSLYAQDSANITNPSQADLLLGTRVPRGITWSTPTKEERLRVLWRGLALSPGAYIRSTFTATSTHLNNKPKDFGQGWGAYTKRNINSFATYSLQDVASEGLAASAGYMKCVISSANVQKSFPALATPSGSIWSPTIAKAKP